jgi:hypothetical protein
MYRKAVPCAPVSTRLGSRDTASAGKIITESSPARCAGRRREMKPVYIPMVAALTIYSANTSAMGS